MRIAVACLGAVLYGVEMLSGYAVPTSIPDMVYVLAMYAGLGMVVWNAFVGSSLVVLLWMAVYFITAIEAPSSTIIIGSIMLALLGYVNVPAAVAFAVCGPALMGVLLRWHGLPMMAAWMLLLAVGGGLARSQVEQASLRRGLEERRRRERVASELHDTVCNDLSHALRLIDMRRDGGGVGADAGDAAGDNVDGLADIREAVEEALLYTRGAIGTLHDDAATASSGGASRPHSPGLAGFVLFGRVGSVESIDMSALVEERRKRLESGGIDGIILMEDRLVVETTPERAEILCGFIRELFGNIGRHADPNRGYTFAVGVRASVLHLSCSDTPLAEPSRASGHAQETIGGRGLAYYRSAFAELGGGIRVHGDADCWTLQADLPLTDDPGAIGSLPRRRR
ncbi:hypothetical protein JS528_07805 [Bifidobacterium sp. MA2]|uniref:Histidine kinase n=1 Tax=Bifidobacterium santillanense TaxID=2809028 RepID=A0ABS5UR11_9BIFI|nr:hypothetical protein [Bifidobacterium santillanense]